MECMWLHACILHALQINSTLVLCDKTACLKKQQFVFFSSWHYYLFIYTLFHFPAPFSYQIAFQSFGKYFRCVAMHRKPILDRLFGFDFHGGWSKPNIKCISFLLCLHGNQTVLASYWLQCTRTFSASLPFYYHSFTFTFAWDLQKKKIKQLSLGLHHLSWSFFSYQSFIPFNLLFFFFFFLLNSISSFCRPSYFLLKKNSILISLPILNDFNVWIYRQF